MVWCHFPEFLQLNPAQKARPVLVRRVIRSSKRGAVYVEVAYGSSQLKASKFFGKALFVTDLRDMKAAGLNLPTRFDLENTFKLPWGREFFVKRSENEKGPKIGRLSLQCQERLKHL